MDKYIFRGQEITGAHAYSLLRAIKMVLTEAPNPTLEEVNELTKIVYLFEKQIAAALHQNEDLMNKMSDYWLAADADGLKDE